MAEDYKQKMNEIIDLNHKIISSTSIGILAYKQSGECVSANEAASRIINVPVDDLKKQNFLEINSWKESGLLSLVQSVINCSETKSKELHLNSTSGKEFWAEFSISCFISNNEPHVLLVFNDITERKISEQKLKLDERRFESLYKISQYHGNNEQDLLDFALEEAIILTQSEIGYIYHYYENKKEFVLNTWSKQVMKECKIIEPQTVYQLEKTGIWGEAVRQRKPVILNDFTAYHPLKKGYPEGHSKLLKYLTIPVFKNEEIVGVVAVANKKTDYNQSDVMQLTLLMNAVWRINEQKQVERELRIAKDEALSAVKIKVAG